MARGSDEEQTDSAAAPARRAGERGHARRRLPRELTRRVEALPDWLADEPSQGTVRAVSLLGTSMLTPSAPSFPVDVRNAARMLRQAIAHGRTDAPCARELTEWFSAVVSASDHEHPRKFEVFAQHLFYVQGIYLQVVAPLDRGRFHLRERVDSRKTLCGFSVPPGLGRAAYRHSYHSLLGFGTECCERCRRSALLRGGECDFPPENDSLPDEAVEVNEELAEIGCAALLDSLAGLRGSLLLQGSPSTENVDAGLRELARDMAAARRSVVRRELARRHAPRRALDVIRRDCPRIHEDVLVATYGRTIPEPSMNELLALLDGDQPFTRADVLAYLFEHCWERALPALDRVAEREAEEDPSLQTLFAGPLARFHSPSAQLIWQAFDRHHWWAKNDAQQTTRVPVGAAAGSP